MLDVDCKDRSLGISCPPPTFLEPNFIQSVKHCLNSHGKIISHCYFILFHNVLMFFTGIFFMNLVCRDEARRNSVTEMLRESFTSVQVKKIKGEINEIITCHVSTPTPSKSNSGRKSSKK